MTTSPPPSDPRPGWGEALFTGAPGIALLHIERALTGCGSWDVAHKWAAATTRSPVTAHPDSCGLDRGAPAVAFTLRTAGRPGYAAALAVLDEHIATVTRFRLQQAHDRIDARQRPALREYDLIRGLTGVGVYLLRRDGSDGLLDVLSYLVQLTEPLTVDGEVLPGWWSANAADDRPSPRWPGGHGNLGMAHGIAGPLALLSTAMLRGRTVTGQADAIERICAWLDHCRRGTGPRTWWPETVTVSEHRTGTVQQAGPGRPSWCYGTPGLARAQQLAALALADSPRQRRAEQALAGCIADERQLAQLTDATLCHGWAGLVHTTRRVAADADDGSFAVPYLAGRLRQHLLHQGPPAAQGLLDGAAGVQLVQRAETATRSPASRWDACLLLDGQE